MICFDQVAPTHSLLLAAPYCTAGLHRCTAKQHHLPFGTIDTSDTEMNAAMTMSLCHVDLASGHIQQSIPAGQMFAQGAFEGSALIYFSISLYLLYFYFATLYLLYFYFAIFVIFPFCYNNIMLRQIHCSGVSFLTFLSKHSINV